MRLNPLNGSALGEVETGNPVWHI